MSKITRQTQLIFGSNATSNEIGVFGSLAANSIAYSTVPTTIQSLSQYLSGWFSAVVGGNSPAIEDMNAIHYLYAYQLAYLMQTGVPEWDSGTTYYIGSVVSDVGTGNLYVSLTNSNLNNAVTSATNWRGLSLMTPTTITSAGSITVANAGGIVMLDSTTGAFNLQLPNPSTMKYQTVRIFDSTGMLATNAVTLVRFASESIQGLVANYALSSAWGSYQLFCDGTNYFLI